MKLLMNLKKIGHHLSREMGIYKIVFVFSNSLFENEKNSHYLHEIIISNCQIKHKEA